MHRLAELFQLIVWNGWIKCVRVCMCVSSLVIRRKRVIDVILSHLVNRERLVRLDSLESLSCDVVHNSTCFKVEILPYCWQDCLTGSPHALALMCMRTIGDYCCYHVTLCRDRIIFVLPDDTRSSVLGQYWTDTDALDQNGISLVRTESLSTRSYKTQHPKRRSHCETASSWNAAVNIQGTGSPQKKVDRIRPALIQPACCIQSHEENQPFEQKYFLMYS